MARRSSILSLALDEADANANAPAELGGLDAAETAALRTLKQHAGQHAAPTERPARRVNPNAGKFHVGGYYDPADATVEAFRILATRSRRTQQDLLHEAMADLVAKHEAAAKFGG